MWDPHGGSGGAVPRDPHGICGCGAGPHVRQGSAGPTCQVGLLCGGTQCQVGEVGPTYQWGWGGSRLSGGVAVWWDPHVNGGCDRSNMSVGVGPTCQLGLGGSHTSVRVWRVPYMSGGVLCSGTHMSDWVGQSHMSVWVGLVPHVRWGGSHMSDRVAAGPTFHCRFLSGPTCHTHGSHLSC